MTDDRQRAYLDALTPVTVSTPATYAARAAGPIRRAELRDGRQLLGHVWTDDQQAAGWQDEEAAGAAAVQAGARVWGILRDAYEAGIPASGVLNPALFTPDYELTVSDTTP